MGVYRFLDYRLDTARRLLTGPSGSVAIGTRAFDLLTFLVLRRGLVVSRDEVTAAIWTGVTVGANNLNVQVAALRRALGAQAVVTLYGRGLRFGLDVVEERSDVAAPSLPDRPSIAVIPFMDLGCDPVLDWLPDSIVEDVTTELSRFLDLFVVARNSAFTYRDRPRDVRIVSHELGVRYVVEGSARATATRLRVTVQLVDAVSGGHVWAETFDEDASAHLDVSRRIAQVIVTALAPQVDRAETLRIRRATRGSMDAFG
ncbi:MAG: winged helix-turn-helix domain-containing protein, partial [Litorimonas sp.]